MAITKRQFEAANARGAEALARGPQVRAARYDARRALIVVSLDDGCEFAFWCLRFASLDAADRNPGRREP